MKIYVLVKCVTIDKRDAIGNICDVQVFRTKEEAKAVVQKNIDWEIGCDCLLKEDILKNEHDSPYYLNVNYDAQDGYGSNDHFQWQVDELEIKEEIIKHQKTTSHRTTTRTYIFHAWR